MTRLREEILDAALPSRPSRLKVALIAGDLISVWLAFVVVAWLMGQQIGSSTDAAKVIVVAPLVAFWSIRSQGLFLTRVSAVRAVEFTRLARSMLMVAAAMLMLDRVGLFHLRITGLAVASALAFLFALIHRSGYRVWLTSGRARGLYQRRMLVVGTDVESVRIVNLFHVHRELGIEIVGVVGDADAAREIGLMDRWIGTTADTALLAAEYGASGVVLSTNSIPADQLKEMIQDLQVADLHVHLATGIRGIDGRRLRSLPMSYEPLIYVEATRLSNVQRVVKRGFDLVVAAAGLLVLSPMLLIVAVLIKLDSRGPVLYKQQRVGRYGTTFSVLKFRSMVIGADARLDLLNSTNEREGPLFKMSKDPRVTRIGRLLRHSSIDELPQLLNVLRGQMSLVGPRPALPSEVAEFPLELRRRELVTPGITGLWQVEARDNPSFEAYRRLDMFYVENWSITLDLMILLGTVEQVLARLLFALRRSSEAPADPVAAMPTPYSGSAAGR